MCASAQLCASAKLPLRGGMAQCALPLVGGRGCPAGRSPRLPVTLMMKRFAASGGSCTEAPSPMAFHRRLLGAPWGSLCLHLPWSYSGPPPELGSLWRRRERGLCQITFAGKQMLFSITASKCCFQLFHKTRRDRVPSPAPRLRLACHTHTHTRARFPSLLLVLLLLLLSSSSVISQFVSITSITHTCLGTFEDAFPRRSQTPFQEHRGASAFGASRKHFWGLLGTFGDACRRMSFYGLLSLLDLFFGHF
jgi:hypothetical protein